ncbi:MAG: carboxypeptidase-like regulatory domain-containing protein [Arenimonas sp.]
MKRASLLLMFIVASCAANPSTKISRVIESGGISGVIRYPGDVVPAIRVCALDTQTKAVTCITTKTGQASYSIKGLPAAEYYLVGEIEQWQFKTAGHVLQVQCIRAPCPALLKAVQLEAGQSLADIDLNGFYITREDFPVLPEENK